MSEEARKAQMADDVRTLASTIQGTFVLAGYTTSQSHIVWSRVKTRVEQWLDQERHGSM